MWNTGHVYFTLKDPAAQLKAVMFRSAYRYLKFKIEDGLHVVARGRLSVYEPKGEYQLVCEHLEPHGRGALQLAFEQLKRKLHAEGLFATARKRPIPALPRKIGIVTSLDGAALRDILKVLSRRHPNAHIVVRPVRVQGEGAADDIATALKAIANVPGVDVIIVGRGGGSIEDLWAFNEESLARAIAACPVPVISAVGHEVDVTIADFVADLRAPTPSAAAEMVVTAKEEFCARIDRLHGRLQAAMRSGIQRRRNVLHVLTSRRGLAGWHVRVAMQGRHVSELTHGLRRAATALVARRTREHQARAARLEARDVRRSLAAVRSRLAAADTRLARDRAPRSTSATAARFAALAGRLEILSPLAVLARGYAVCWNERSHRDHPPGVGRGARRRGPGHASRRRDSTARCAAPMDPTIKDFESASAELEAIVKKMEEGDLTLEKALELYERGVQLSRFCHARLEEAERRLEILNERGETQPGARRDGTDAARRGRQGPVTPDDALGRGSTRGASWSTQALDRFLPTGAAGAVGHHRGDALQRVRRRQAAAPDAGAGGGRGHRGLGRPRGRCRPRGWRCPRPARIEMIHTYSLVHDDLPGHGQRHAAPRPAHGARGLRRRHGDSLRRRAADRGVRPAGARAAARAIPRRFRRASWRGASSTAIADDRRRRGRARAWSAARPSISRPPNPARRRSARTACARCTRARPARCSAPARSPAPSWPARRREVLDAVADYGTHVGLAFQIVDDILDVEGASAVLGKTAGKDAAAGKPTYPALYGLEESRRRAQASMNSALEALAMAGIGGQLPAIARWVVARTH